MNIDDLKFQLDELYKEKHIQHETYHRKAAVAKLAGDLSTRCKLMVEHSEYLSEFTEKKMELLSYLTTFKEFVYGV